MPTLSRLRLFTSDQTIDFVTLLDAVISDGVFPSADEAKVYLTGLAETVPSISNVKAYAQRPRPVRTVSSRRKPVGMPLYLSASGPLIF